MLSGWQRVRYPARFGDPLVTVGPWRSLSCRLRRQWVFFDRPAASAARIVRHSHVACGEPNSSDSYPGGSAARDDLSVAPGVQAAVSPCHWALRTARSSALTRFRHWVSSADISLPSRSRTSARTASASRGSGRCRGSATSAGRPSAHAGAGRGGSARVPGGCRARVGESGGLCEHVRDVGERAAGHGRVQPLPRLSAGHQGMAMVTVLPRAAWPVTA